MYSYSKFNSAKIDLAYSFFQKPTDSLERVELAFLRRLLTAAAERGCVTPGDVCSAVEESGVFNLNLDDESKDKVIADLWNIGDQYVGELSVQQTQQLRQLRKLCIRAAMLGEDGRTWSEISELLQS
jgi:hypothetical protein